MLAKLLITASALLLSTDTCWSQWNPLEVGRLVATDGLSLDDSGRSVAVSGNTAVVGAPGRASDTGAAFVFEWDGTAWAQQATLTADDGAPDDLFGWSCAVSGDTIVVGAFRPGSSQAGSAYVYVRNGSTWAQQSVLNGSSAKPDEFFGVAVATSGDTVLVGSTYADREDLTIGSRVGAVYAFDRSGATWTQSSKFWADDSTINHKFGGSIWFSGNTALIGAPGADIDRGSAYFFTRTGSTWTEGQKLTGAGLEINDNFGASLDVSDTTLLIGAPDALGGGAGSAFIFEFNGSTWLETQRLTASDQTLGDQFGAAVALEDDLALIGGWGNDTSVGANAGSAYLFTRSASTWSELEQLAAGDTEAFDYFGRSVAMSGATLFIGADGDDQSSTPDLGSVYVMEQGPVLATYCTAGTSATGCQAMLSGSGIPSATAASGFLVSATTVESNKDGLFFFGMNGRQASPWGQGTSFQCVIPPVKRGGLMTGTGTINQCDGAFALDLNALWCPSCSKPNHNPGLGSTVQVQLWYRDPFSTSLQTTSLSNALEFTLQP